MPEPDEDSHPLDAARKRGERMRQMYSGAALNLYDAAISAAAWFAAQEASGQLTDPTARRVHDRLTDAINKFKETR